MNAKLGPTGTNTAMERKIAIIFYTNGQEPGIEKHRALIGLLTTESSFFSMEFAHSRDGFDSRKSLN